MFPSTHSPIPSWSGRSRTLRYCSDILLFQRHIYGTGRGYGENTAAVKKKSEKTNRGVKENLRVYHKNLYSFVCNGGLGVCTTRVAQGVNHSTVRRRMYVVHST